MIRYYLLLLLLSYVIVTKAQSPFVVYNRSQGVILQTLNKGEVINKKDPVRGTPVFNEDRFILNDERYFVKIKDRKGEIFTYNGKGTVSPKNIVNQQKFNLFNRFKNILIKTSEDIGFSVTPVHTIQCVTRKGGERALVDSKIDSISNAVAKLISQDVTNNNYYHGVSVKRDFIDEELFNYSIENNDSALYAFVLYTVSKDGINKHDDVIVQDEDGNFKPSHIEFFHLYNKSALKLDYFTMSSKEEEKDDRTCYVLLFKRSDFYEDIKSSLFDYKRLINWSIIEKELIYQGDVDRVLLLRR